jgi:hypothetical protein
MSYHHFVFDGYTFADEGVARDLAVPSDSGVLLNFDKGADFGVVPDGAAIQIDEFGKSVFTRFNNPDFVTLAKSFGAIGYYVKSTEEFSKTLEKAKESTSVPVIIAIDVDYSTNQILLNDDFND